MTLKWHVNDTLMTLGMSKNSLKIAVILQYGKWHKNDTKMTRKWHVNDTKMTLECQRILKNPKEFKKSLRKFDVIIKS